MSSMRDYFKIKKVGNGNEASPAGILLPDVSHTENKTVNWPLHDRDSVDDRSRSGSGSTSSYADVLQMKCDVVANWLHSKQESKRWTNDLPGEGVVLRMAKGRYVCCPSELEHDGSGFYQMAEQLNIQVAMTVSNKVIEIILRQTKQPYIKINGNLRIQVLSDIADLPHCQRHQCAAFIASKRMLLVWDDNPEVVLQRADYIQDALIRMTWDQKTSTDPEEQKPPPFVESAEKEEDTEMGEEKPRRTMLNQTMTCAATIVLVLASIGGGWSKVAVEVLVDKNYIRLALLPCVIPQIWLAVFFFQALIGNLTQLIGPVGHMKDNTKFYSGKLPRRLKQRHELPHITIQMPVYKEGLKAVIQGTILSVKAAMTTYELQGGTANIFVNDDGMQVLSDKEALERQEFYEKHNIGWVARPRHDPTGKDGRKFIRPGKFKKASNMNYGLGISCSVEKLLAEIDRPADWTKKDEDDEYRKALDKVREATDYAAWADGDIRIGDYILLIDSDTRLPQDCFLDAVSEMEQSPEVSILQYSSGVMNVSDNFFEKGITFFTNLVYTQIRYAVANGDVAPFVGHNAILRWTAIQDIGYECPVDKTEKFWSERTVSEDFDMALRLQTKGYIVRLGAYKGDGYKEGVSLTVYDEVQRWEKYAFGCSELIFHPFKYWLTKGPFRRLFIDFLVSPCPLASKVSIMGYMGTYYALGSAWILTLANYFLVGWYNGFLDHYYIDSFKVYFSIILVFTALGNVALAVLRYRIGEKDILPALLENLTWIPLLVVFLGGVSVHISQALLSHLFSIDMEWGSTNKELDNTPFFQEIPKVIKRFKYTFSACLIGAAGMIVLAKAVPDMWKITFFTPTWPLACVLASHFLLPIVLNPNLMLFTW